MRRFRRSSFARSFLLPFAFTVWLGACHSWVPARPPAVEFPAQAAMPIGDRNELRVTVGTELAAEGKLLELTADSVAIHGEDSTVVIPVEDVSQVLVKKGDVGKSILLGIGVVAGAFLLLVAGFAIYCAADEYNCDFS